MHVGGVSRGPATLYVPLHMSENAHILVVDDDARLRDLLRQFLSRHGYHVTTAGHAEAAGEKLGAITFDILVLDVMMPGENGVEFARRLRQSSTVPILLLTAMGETHDRIAGLAAGADDYLVKPFEPDELLLRVRAILRRAPPPASGPAEVRFGEFRFDIAHAVLFQNDTQVRLTAAEASLLAVLAARPGLAISREELLRQSSISGSDRTIDVQVTRLRRKIETDPKLPRYLQTVRGSGYLLRTD
jgi:two-component system, OmpR family, phosphate regulon response regulator OmpR